jgi:hypothetical protein
MEHLYHQTPTILELQLGQIMKYRNFKVNALHLINYIERQTIKSWRNYQQKLFYAIACVGLVLRIKQTLSSSIFTRSSQYNFNVSKHKDLAVESAFQKRDFSNIY